MADNTNSKMSERMKVSRRDALRVVGLTAGEGIFGSASRPVYATGLPDYPAVAPETGDTIAVSNTAPVVKTNCGKVRGYVRKGIYTFKGIPYADTTAGANRFMAPQKPKPWTGIRSSMQFGEVCPQPARFGRRNDEEAWLFSWNDGVSGEDCLRVNLWTPGINDGKKRPVMRLHHSAATRDGLARRSNNVESWRSIYVRSGAVGESGAESGCYKALRLFACGCGVVRLLDRCVCPRRARH
jgi:para-nitrobenzyl esterase